MKPRRMEFGYYPLPLQLNAGPVSIFSLPDLEETAAKIEASASREGDWIYAPPERMRDFNGQVRVLPYSSRVFGLPKTHTIMHATAQSDTLLEFHLWTLSFFEGMRLTAADAGFVDATPLAPGKLVDFVLVGKSLVEAIALAEAFWQAHIGEARRARLFTAAVHALFLGCNPRLLQFEEFMLLYSAFDACFALAESIHRPKSRPIHASRVHWMCSLFGMATPSWADPALAVSPEVASLRNAAIHEALYAGGPLGFALHGLGTNQNMTLEMKALICRLLVALLGGDQAAYVRTPVNTRQRHGLELP